MEIVTTIYKYLSSPIAILLAMAFIWLYFDRSDVDEKDEETKDDSKPDDQP